MKREMTKPSPRAVARIVARAQAITKRYTDGNPEASVDAFLARRVDESGV